jgi:hypothetical protein
MRLDTPYVLVGLGLVAGLVVLLFEPLPAANPLVGWVSVVVAVAGVTYLIVAGSGPDRRGPDF